MTTRLNRHVTSVKLVAVVDDARIEQCVVWRDGISLYLNSKGDIVLKNNEQKESLNLGVFDSTKNGYAFVEKMISFAEKHLPEMLIRNGAAYIWTDVENRRVSSEIFIYNNYYYDDCVRRKLNKLKVIGWIK